MTGQANGSNASGKNRRLRANPATGIALLALFISLGGTSIAASGLIDGNKIKPGSVTAKQLRNRTITTSKLAAKTVTELRGARGPAGPAALPAAREDESLGVAIPADAGAVDLAELSLPAGRFVVFAKATIRTNSPAEISCWVTPDYGDYIDSSDWSAPGGFTSGTLALTGVSPPGTKILTLRCSTDDVAATAMRNKLVAIPVAG